MGSEATCIIRYLVKHMLASSPNAEKSKRETPKPTFTNNHQTDWILHVDYVTGNIKNKENVNQQTPENDGKSSFIFHSWRLIQPNTTV